MIKKIAVLCSMVLALGMVAKADPIVTLVNENSTASLNLGSAEGMYSWTVDGVDQLEQQWFWYRIGSTGGESPINKLGYVTHSMSSPNELWVQYGGSPILVDIWFTLVGTEPGSGQSDVAESIRITNKSTTTLSVHFFQYCDLDLGTEDEDLWVEISGGNTAMQQDVGCYSGETVVTRRPEHYQVAFFGDILASLNNSSPTTLTDVSGPIGPGNLTWAFQWDFSIAKGRSVLISKDKLIVPEPATLCLLAGGGLALLRRRRGYGG